MEMIQPNRLKQAQQELATVNFDNGFEIPTEINDKEAKYYYCCVGVKEKVQENGGRKTIQNLGYKLFATVKKWNEMKRQVKSKIFKREFGDAFDYIVIVHDPMAKPAKVEKKVKALSPKHKKEVKALMEENKSAEEISIELGIDIERIEAFLK